MSEHSDTEFFEKFEAYLNGDASVGTTCNAELTAIGRQPAPPATIDDSSLQVALTELVWSLCDLGVTVENTDHLCDRDLYSLLWEAIHESTFLCPEDLDMTFHISALEDADFDNYLRYYADEDTRSMWVHDFPGEPIPPTELPPYPRPWIENLQRFRQT